MSAEKTEWPNEARLNRLREVGTVPLSLFSCRCVWSLVYLFSLWMLRARVFEMATEFQKPVASQSASVFLEALIAVIVFPLISAAVITIFWALFQTKFLFRFGLVSLDFSRLFHFRAPQPVGIFSRVLVSLGLAAVTLAIGLLCARLCWTGVLYLLNNDRLYAGTWFLGILQMMLVPISILLAVGALLGLLVEKFSFAWRHRMSREEIEREIVESKITL